MAENALEADLAATLGALSLENDSGLGPLLTDLSNKSVAAYLRDHPPISSALEDPTFYCLPCSKRISPNVEVHIAVYDHSEPLGAFCVYCCHFVITTKEKGFEEHLTSKHHGILSRNKDKILKNKRNLDAGSGKEYFSKTQQITGIEPKPTMHAQQKTKTEQKPTRHAQQKTKTEPKPTMHAPQKNPKKQLHKLIGPQEKMVTYFVQGLSSELDLYTFYDLCEQFGRVKELKLNLELHEAYVTYYNVISGLRSTAFGPHSEFEAVKYMPQDEGWIVWNDLEHITPYSSQIFSIKMNIQKMVTDLLSQCRDETNSCFLKIKRIKGEIINLLKPVYTTNNAKFFGPAMVGLTSRNEILFFYLDVSAVNENAPDLVTYISETSGNRKIEITGLLNDPSAPKMLGNPGHILLHKPTNVKFVLCVVNSVACINDIYIKLYLAIDNRVSQLIIAFREWWIMNMASFDVSVLNSPIEWLVIFFLMQRQTHLVPSVEDIQSTNIQLTLETKGTEIHFLGKTLRDKVKPFLNQKDCIYLLIELILFYQKMDFSSTLMCPLTGAIKERAEHSWNDENIASSSENPKSADAVLNSAIILLHPLEPTLNLFQGSTSALVKSFKNKLDSTIKCML